MASRRGRRARKCEALSRRALGTLTGLVSLVCLSGIAAIILAIRTTEPDLFDLVPKVSHSDGYLLLAWPNLERGRQALNTVAVPSGTMIRALGYMVERDVPVRDGRRVDSFILLPDIGNFLHPAHRFGDQMISVRLASRHTVPFAEKSLVWAWGALRTLPGDPAGHEPLYILEDARSEPAGKGDIAAYFR
jgi:hypothetical protein